MDDVGPGDDRDLEFFLETGLARVVGDLVVDGPDKTATRRLEPVEAVDEAVHPPARVRFVARALEDLVRPVQVQDGPHAQTGEWLETLEIGRVVEGDRRDAGRPRLPVEERLERVELGDRVDRQDGRWPVTERLERACRLDRLRVGPARVPLARRPQAGLRGIGRSRDGRARVARRGVAGAGRGFRGCSGFGGDRVGDGPAAPREL